MLVRLTRIAEVGEVNKEKTTYVSINSICRIEEGRWDEKSGKELQFNVNLTMKMSSVNISYTEVHLNSGEIIAVSEKIEEVERLLTEAYYK